MVDVASALGVTVWLLLVVGPLAFFAVDERDQLRGEGEEPNPPSPLS
jgi:hypothetical protein